MERRTELVIAGVMATAAAALCTLQVAGSALQFPWATASDGSMELYATPTVLAASAGGVEPVVETWAGAQAQCEADAHMGLASVCAGCAEVADAAGMLNVVGYAVFMWSLLPLWVRAVGNRDSETLKRAGVLSGAAACALQSAAVAVFLRSCVPTAAEPAWRVGLGLRTVAFCCAAAAWAAVVQWRAPVLGGGYEDGSMPGYLRHVAEPAAASRKFCPHLPTRSQTRPSPMAPARGQVQMMRHRKKVDRLGRPADQRKALMRALTTEVIRHGRIQTTKVKAMAVRKHVDHMITLAKDGSLHSRRQALGYIYDEDLVCRLFEGAPERFGDRQGGYTRVIRLPKLRRGDATEMALIELV